MLNACKDKSNKDSPEEELTSAAVSFVQAVEDIGEITLESNVLLNRARLLYNTLSVDDYEFNAVIEAKVKLDDLQSQYDALNDTSKDDDYLQKQEAKILEFIAEANALPINIALTDAVAISSVTTLYNAISIDTSAYEGFTSAKTKYETALAQYRGLKDADDAQLFLELAADSHITMVTLDSKSYIELAENAYSSLSDSVKTLNEVIAAKILVDAAHAEYNIILEADQSEKIEAFLSAVQDLPDIENLEINSFYAIQAASLAYDMLIQISKDKVEVAEAYAIFAPISDAFDLLGYRQLQISDPKLVLSADTVPNLVLQNDGNMYSSFGEFYEVTTWAALQGKVKMYLYVYTEGKSLSEYSGRVDINLNTLANGRIILGSTINAAVNTVAQLDSSIVGKPVAFSINFEDVSGQYLPSNFFKMTGFSSKYA